MNTFLLLLSTAFAVEALGNGLGLTPPMGWLTWERFRCNTDCAKDPANCISERLIKETADAMVSKGFKAAGYEYVIIDDCWLDKERDSNGKLQADKTRFPSGIKSLANYVHDLGLKFGIYQDIGSHTCAGYPGLQGHLKQDAETLAGWGVDYVKIDGCYINETEIPQEFTKFGSYLNATGRPIFYSCEWANYLYKHKADFKAISNVCNMCRVYEDINDSWWDVLNKTDFVANHQDDFAQYARPGYWNDPDMLLIGNFGLSSTQSRAQMALWSIMSAPLIMSTDLRTIRERDAKILKNQRVIEINQDPLGHQGRRIVHNQKRKFDIFLKPITSRGGDNSGGSSAAVAVLYRGTAGTPIRLHLSPKSIGLADTRGYRVEDVFDGRHLGDFKAGQGIPVKVDPTGATLLRLDVLTSNNNNSIFDNEYDDDEIDADFNFEIMGMTGWKTIEEEKEDESTNIQIGEEEHPEIVILN